MLQVLGCFAHQHDNRLVALAALVCVLASCATIQILHHARASSGRLQGFWIGAAAVASGFGIWATHFIAMLAFVPGLDSGYDVGLTVASLLAAVLVTGTGLWIAIMPRWVGAAWLGGGVIGTGIAAMHYTGMAAFEVAGHLTWDHSLVVASIAFGVAAGACALPAGLRGTALRQKAGGALLLTMAICGHHFTAMGAVGIAADPLVTVPQHAMPGQEFAVVIAVFSLGIIMLALVGLTLDNRERRRREQTDLALNLSNAAVEGVMLCDGNRILTVNHSLAALLGCEAESLIGKPLDEMLPSVAATGERAGTGGEPVEADLPGDMGTVIPVEITRKFVTLGGRPHQAFVVRDLRTKRQTEQQMRFLAHHDALTGLPNRASFNARLDREIEQAVAGGRRLAVLFLDLDRFKEINDLLGHAAGDDLLRGVGRCISSILDDGQVIARLGGDEFAVLLPGLSDPTVAGKVASDIVNALRIEGATSLAGATIATSIGIAVCPDDADNRHDLLSYADVALYRAKADGRGTHRFFEAEMGARMRDRRMLERDLRQSLQGDEFHLAYQPQMAIGTGEVVGFEALLRWHNPQRGAISPGLFIPIAEEIGVIVPIGEWVLRTACHEAAGWDRPLPIAVNVSAVQVHNPNFPALVHEILLQTGLAPQRLELEVTETALIRDFDRALSTLRRLKALGVRIAMDDFGTGYASLSSLRAFPFDRIKIDRSFIRSVDHNGSSAAIVRAILGLGRELDLPVLAEGVETSGEMAFLKTHRCPEAQGFLIGRPAAIESFAHQTGGKKPDRPSSGQAPLLIEPGRTPSAA